MADQRILTGRPATISAQFVDQNGKAAAPTGTVTVAVAKADGTVIKTAGTATAGTSTAPRTVALTATEVGAVPDELHVTWTDSGGGALSTVVAIVGGYYATVDAIRALPNLADASKFTDDELIAARAWFETRFEEYTGRAFVSRYRRLTLVGRGEPHLTLPDTDLRAVRTVSIDGTAIAAGTVAALQFVGSTVRASRYVASINSSTSYSLPFGYPSSAVVVAYEYGLDTPPEDVRQAALLAIRSKLLNDQTGTPMLSVADGAGGTTRFLLADDNRPFGIPFVDTVANARRRADQQITSLPIMAG